MEEGKENKEGTESSERDEVYSKAVRAGKRTYFFDVKTNRRNELYLTITESKKRFHNDGHFFYEKHKIFLYKEDFENFFEGLNDIVDYITVNSPNEVDDEYTEEPKTDETSTFTDVDFDDLENLEITTTNKNENS